MMHTPPARPMKSLPLVLCFCLLLRWNHAWGQPPAQRLADYFGFQSPELYKLDNRIGNLALKDLDGDQIDDVIASNNARSRIDLLLSGTKQADDQASRPFRKNVNDLEYDHRMRQVGIPVNREVVSLDVGDFNGDGKPDLVFYGTPAEVQILFNEGHGKFASPKKIQSGDAIRMAGALTVGDLDRDGRDDIALLGEKELILVYQTAPGHLSEPERIPHTAAEPWVIKTIDLDGDGARDLVMLDSASDHPVHIWFATAEKKLGPEQRFAVEVPRAVAFAQVDGKGGSEILTIENQSGRARVLALDDSAVEDADKRGRLVFYALPQGSERGRSLAIGDVDGDRRQDVIVTDPQNAQVWVFPQTGHSGLGAGQSFPSLGNARTVRLTRRPGQSKADVYLLSDTEKQIGRSTFENGRLAFPTPLPVAGEPVAMDLADINGDDAPEVVYVARTAAGSENETFALRLLTIDSAGTARPGKWGQSDSVALPSLKNTPAGMKSVDVNQDGLADLLIFNQYGSPLLVLAHSGRPPSPFAGSLGPLSSATPTAVSQLLRDGPGLTVAQSTFARRVVLDPAGHWIIKDQYNSGRSAAQILGAAALDTDGDGKPEIVLFDRTSKSLLFLSQKDGVYRAADTLQVGAFSFVGLHVADLDGDGKDDLLIAGTDRFGVLQTGRRGQRLKAIASFESRRSEARFGDLAAGDLNSDGAPDIVFSDVGDQSLEIATFAGDKELLPAITFRIFERKTFRTVGDIIEPRDMAIGDVDGDHRADIVLIVHDRVLIYRQDAGTPAKQPTRPRAKSSGASRKT
jgi:hypothetical protein